MKSDTIYILGAGAIGVALAANLIENGRDILLVRTSTANLPESTVELTVHSGDNFSKVLHVPAQVVSLSQLGGMHGTIVVTVKAYANQQIAAQLKEKGTRSPIVILQNGLNVEEPYLAVGFGEVYRCVLYATSQKASDYAVRFRQVTSSPIGLIKGSANRLQASVERLNTPDFTFHASPNIQEAIWQKAIINAVFNTVCPLLEVDNGIFARDEAVARIANDIVGESVQVAQALGLRLEQEEIMEQLLKISQGSDGQLISTLQDINRGRRTEIESLNLEIAAVAARLNPAIEIEKTKLLGDLILLKSLLAAEAKRG